MNETNARRTAGRRRWSAGIAAAALWLAAAPAAACTCVADAPFMAAAAPVVVTVRVVGYGPTLTLWDAVYESMRVQVLEVLAGEPGRRELRVLGDPGHLCRPCITELRFERGQDYVMALHRGAKGECEISSCGEYWLTRREGKVVGRIRGVAEAMPYVAFRALFAQTR